MIILLRCPEVTLFLCMKRLAEPQVLAEIDLKQAQHSEKRFKKKFNFFVAKPTQNLVNSAPKTVEKPRNLVEKENPAPHTRTRSPNLFSS